MRKRRTNLSMGTGDPPGPIVNGINRRAFLRTAAAGVGALALPAVLDAKANKARRPNILFAIADDWGWPHAGAYGDPVVKTPGFDRLAAEGALFHHAYI